MTRFELFCHLRFLCLHHVNDWSIQTDIETKSWSIIINFVPNGDETCGWTWDQRANSFDRCVKKASRGRLNDNQN